MECLFTAALLPFVGASDLAHDPDNGGMFTGWGLLQRYSPVAMPKDIDRLEKALGLYDPSNPFDTGWDRQ